MTKENLREKITAGFEKESQRVPHYKKRAHLPKLMYLRPAMFLIISVITFSALTISVAGVVAYYINK